MTLTLERRGQADKTPTLGNETVGMIMMTPPIDEDYWAYRVKVSETQAIVGFPKFSTIGVGFAVEEDWNSNLPYTTAAEEIFEHIAHNKGDDAISDADCIEAIRLIQAAVGEDRAPKVTWIGRVDGKSIRMPSERAAEDVLAAIQKHDPEGVERGDYFIDVDQGEGASS